MLEEKLLVAVDRLSNSFPFIQRMGNAILLVETESDSVVRGCLSGRECTKRSGIQEGKVGSVFTWRNGKVKEGRGIQWGILRNKYAQAILYYFVTVNVNF